MTNIYVLQSKLFGTPRIIQTNFPVDISTLEVLANQDNNYPSDKGWRVVNQVSDWCSDPNLTPIVDKDN